MEMPARLRRETDKPGKVDATPLLVAVPPASNPSPASAVEFRVTLEHLLS